MINHNKSSTHAAARGGEGLEKSMGILMKDRPIRAIVGATVMGPTNFIMGPIRPRAPTNTSTEDAAISDPDICKT